MSENEKYEQVGRLAEEYSRIKGELNHVEEKINRAKDAFQIAGPALASNGLRLDAEDQLSFIPGQRFIQQPKADMLRGLMNHGELLEAFRARKTLVGELEVVCERLRGLAPHLV